MHQSVALAALGLGATVYAQQVGTLKTESHPKLSTAKCTAGGKCTTEQHSVVLDANWRWLHSTSGSTNCYTGNKFDATLCPDSTTCASNCAVDGADYSGTYGITSAGDALTLRFVTGNNVGSRTYLMDASDSKYEMFDLLNQEFTVNVDVSKLPCGLNGALYFVSMDADGGVAKYPSNKAGSKYGTGYCDSQCPQDLKFIQGSANLPWTPSSNSPNSGTGARGTCCTEMDIWEANSISAAYTPHPCDPIEESQCTSDKECGVTDRTSGVCDKSGCDFNSYRQGNTTFYGPGLTIDTNKPFDVVTQFITDDNTATGNLVEIKRFYVQGGTVFENSQSDIAGVPGNSITDEWCDAQKVAFDDANDHKAKGGLKAMGEAFMKGMVLVLSIWDDTAVNMLWLDAPFPANLPTSKPGVVRGTCGADSGKPSVIEKESPDAQVIFANIRTGPIGSTFSGSTVGGGSGSGSGSTPPVVSSVKPSSAPSSTKASTMAPAPTTPTTTAAAPSTPTPPAGGNCASMYAQCGGIGYTGPTCCASGSTCKSTNQYYSQCL